MRPNYQSCHSYIRRPNVPADVLTPFYRDVVGLPIIRPVGEMVTFWAGEDLGFEIKCDDLDRGDHADPSQAQCLPLFRTYDLAATTLRLDGADVSWSTDRTEYGVRVWAACPDGHLIGFEERSVESPLASDQEAATRWLHAKPRLADLPALPGELQYLNRIVTRVDDVAGVSGFYSDVLDLDLLGYESGSALHSLGDTVILEIAPGGFRRDPPTDRIEVANVLMTRVHDLDDCLTDAVSGGARLCGDVIEFFTGTRAAYLIDPEGNLFGVQQRTLWGDYPEDLESDWRWRTRPGL